MTEKSAGALDFAHRWGLLESETIPLTLEPLSKGRKRKPAPVRWAGQSVGAWLDWAAGMREALELWRAICEVDLTALKRVVSIVREPAPPKRRVARYDAPRGGGFVLTQPLPRRSLTDAASLCLAKLVNDRLEAPIQLRYDGAREGQKLSLYVRPGSLRAAVWAQFAESVARDEARSCPRCGRVFIVYKTSGRRPEHCSDACRVAMHRRRKKAAGRRKTS